MNTALAPVSRLRTLFDEDRCLPAAPGSRRFAGNVVLRSTNSGGLGASGISGGGGGGSMHQLMRRQENLEKQIGQLVTTLQSMTVQPPAVVPQHPVQQERAPVVRRKRKVEPSFLSKFFD